MTDFLFFRFFRNGGHFSVKNPILSIFFLIMTTILEETKNQKSVTSTSWLYGFTVLVRILAKTKDPVNRFWKRPKRQISETLDFHYFSSLFCKVSMKELCILDLNIGFYAKKSPYGQCHRFRILHPGQDRRKLSKSSLFVLNAFIVVACLVVLVITRHHEVILVCNSYRICLTSLPELQKAYQDRQASC